MRTRQDCEAEITAALATYRLATEVGDNLGADYERAAMDELLEELGRMPQQRKPPP
jgi:hypothetical protein